MERLIEQSERVIGSAPDHFKRYLFEDIAWDSRLVGVKGARGTGKTTLMLQHLKTIKGAPNQRLYLSLDNLFFSQHSLLDVVDDFYKSGGKMLVLDEVHQYPLWSQVIKNIFDAYPDLKIVFSGSSIIDLSRAEGDLSRRSVIYTLQGLSYREFLNFKYETSLSAISLEDILSGMSPLKDHPSSLNGLRPYEHFQEYLRVGYYPFTSEEPALAHQRLDQLVRMIVEMDLAQIQGFDIRNAKKLQHLLFIVAQQVPFKPNLSKLAQLTGIGRNTLNDYLFYLEQAQLLRLPRQHGRSVSALAKPEKIFLNNPTLQFALATGNPDVGSLRESFVLSQLSVKHDVTLPKLGDFMVDGRLTLEIGGPGKTNKQIQALPDAWTVKEGLEVAAGRSLPLWLLGMVY